MDKRDKNREKVKRHSSPKKKSSSNRLTLKRIISVLLEKDPPKETAKEESGKTVGKKTLRRSIGSGVYLAAAIVVVIAAMTWALTAFFTVGEIRVYGNSKLSAEEIIGLSGIDPGDSLVLLNGQKIRKNIVGNSAYIENVTIKRVLPDVVEIIVTDKTASLAFEANGAYWLASGSGTLLELSISCPKDVLVIEGVELEDSKEGNTFSCKDEARQIILETVLEALEENDIFSRIDSIDLSETYAAVMVYEGSFDIILGDADDIKADFRKIETIVGEIKSDGAEEGCIDMRRDGIRFTPQRWQGNIFD